MRAGINELKKIIKEELKRVLREEKLKEGVFQDAKQWYEMMFKRSSQCGFLPQLKRAQQNASGYDKNVKNVMDLYYRVRDEQAAKKALIDTLIPATNNRKDYVSLIDLINQYGRDLENTVHADYCGGVSQRGWIVDSFGMTGLQLLKSAGVDVTGITKPQ